MTKTPKISVVMAVYNTANYLAEAIDSILQQTFPDFEFIIIDDKSTDHTAQILEHFAAQDSRIIVVSNEKNIGLPASLNIGLELAKGEYIARMDGDDISLPQRFERQVHFMDNHHNVGVCGTWTKIFGEIQSHHRPPRDDAMIKSILFFGSSLPHPTVFIRRELLQKHNIKYDPTFLVAQDYKLWVEASPYTTFANIQEVLLHYRSHSTQAGIGKKQLQLTNASRTRLVLLKRLGIEPTPQETAVHCQMIELSKPITKEFIQESAEWIQKIKIHNQQTGVFPEPEFSDILDSHWFRVCRLGARHGLYTWRYFWASPLSASIKMKWPRKLKSRTFAVMRAITDKISTSSQNKAISKNTKTSI